MTRDELVILQQRLRDAGASAELVVLVAEVDQELRIRRRCERAIARALFNTPQPVATMQQTPESGVVRESAPDSLLTVPTMRSDRAAAVLAVWPGLSPTARRVGQALVGRVDYKTGRCDPSARTLMADAGLGGTDTRVVRRAIGALEAMGIVRRAFNAGVGHANAYRLDWARIEAMAGVLRFGLTPDSHPGQESALPPDSSPPNQSPESIPISGRGEIPREWDPGAVGAARARGREPFQIPMVLPIPGGRTPASGDRVEAAIRGKYRDHRQRTTYLAAWWELTDAARSEFRDLASFEAWLRAQGPPGARGEIAGLGKEGTG